jgi:hypothetical protein
MPGDESIVGWYRSIDWYWPALRAPLALQFSTATDRKVSIATIL